MNILKEILHKLGRKPLNPQLETDSGEILDMIFQSDMQNLEVTRRELDRDAFALAVQMIEEAENIYILGIRNCQPLADFLGFYLNMMFDRVKLLTTNSTSEIFEQMLRIGSRDVMIGISFPRYSVRTLKAMEYANNRSAKIIAITDSVLSPLNLYSSCNLIAKSEMASVIDSLTAPLSVVNGLIAALSVRHDSQMGDYLEKLVQVWEEYQVYNGDEMDYSDHHIEIWQADRNVERAGNE